MKPKVLFFLILIAIGCDNEPYGSLVSDSGGTDNNDTGDNGDNGDDGDNGDNDPGDNSENFFPSSGYWIYDVDSSSEDLQDLNFVATDSIYIDEEFETYFSLSANNDSFTNGNMNRFLTSGSLYNTPTTLSLDGSLDLPENLSDIGLGGDFSLVGVTLFDTAAENGNIMFLEDGSTSNTISIQGTEIPIDLSYEIRTTKINFYDSLVLNGTNYNNVFEGELALSVSATGTFTVFGFSQTVAFLETQDLVLTQYYFAESIGLVRAQTSQGFTLSSELTDLLNLINITNEIPTSISIESVEDLSDYSLD